MTSEEQGQTFDPDDPEPPKDWAVLNAKRESISADLLRKVAPPRAVDAATGPSFDASAVCCREMATASDIAVLSGDTGVGKTVAAVRAMFEHIADKKFWKASAYGCRRIPERPDMIFITSAALTRVSRFEGNELERILKTELLVIDDLGSEYQDAKGAFQALVDEIVNDRYANHRRTIMTTNLNADAFRERYGRRVVDRIRESGVFIGSNEESRRHAKAE